MSFPGSFSSQLAAIMEALLKAVVAEVTALVEDGAVELRLELRDRDRQILDKEREVEERDRVIEELRAAVEELMAREEAAVSPAEEEDRLGERADSDQGEDDEGTHSIVKREPSEDEPPELLWPPPLLPAPLSAAAKATGSATATTSAAGEYEDGTPSKDQTTQSFHMYHSQATSPNGAEEFSRFEHAELNLETLLNMKQEQFYSAEQPGFSMAPPDGDRNGLNWTKKLNYGAFRCDQCGKTFTGKKRLMTHQTVHTGVKPYSCERCGTRFSRTDSLARHRRKADACCPGKS